MACDLGRKDACDVAEFTEATSIKEAEEFAANNGLVKNTDYSNLTLNQANAANKGLLNLKGKLKNYSPVNKIVSVDDVNYLARMDGNNINFGPSSKTFKFENYSKDITNYKGRINDLNKQLKDNGEFFTASDLSKVKNQISRYEAKLIEMQKYERWGVSSSLDEAVIHEYGHKINTDMALGDYKGINDFLAPSELRSMGIDYKSTLQSRLDGIATNQGYKISEYATTNSQEYFAESFLSKVKGENRGINTELDNIFNQIME